MDYSEHHAAPAHAEKTNTTWMVVRAMLSAAVFGTLGALLGKALGHRGNRERGQIVESMMKWSMGGFWAVLAAYSSLKASEHEEHAARHASAEVATRRDRVAHAEIAEATNAPEAKVGTAHAEHQGLIRENAPEITPQK